MPAILRAPRLGKLHSTGWPGGGGGGPTPIIGALTVTELSADTALLQADLALTTIGPATPEQISLFLAVPDSVPYTATATCEYKRAVDSVWIEGHPLHRIRNDYSSGPFGDTLRHGFAWPIIDLTPGTTYDVRVTKTDGANVTIHTLQHTTRALPGPAGPFNKTASGDADIRAKVAGLVAGDVLQIANGVHDISTGYIVVSSRVGTPAAPIVIRGQSLTGTIIRRASNDIMFLLANLQNVIFENLTIEGSGINNGGTSPPSQVANPTSAGFHVGGQAWTTTNLTIRNCIITGVDKGFYADNRMTGLLIYNNDFIGNNPWVPNNHGPGTMASWGDDGIHFPGEGNCVWQNLIKGFGDSIAYCSGFAQGQQTANASHAYRNDIRDSCDDSCEVDDAESCCTFYDNRITNGVNAISMDAICGGPFVMARNVFLNLFRVRPFKWNSPNSGHFHYCNTIYMPQHGSTDPADDSVNGAHWYLPGSDVPQRAKGYRNNIHVFTGSMARLMKMAPVVHTNTDWTHNSWYPDGPIEFSTAAVANLAAMKALNFNIGQVFAPPGTTLMQNDTVTVANPWATAITLPATAAGELLGDHVPVPAHASLKYTGVAIPNITDGYTGPAPDRGAVIEGRPQVAYGNQTGVSSGLPAWVPAVAYQWADVPGTIWTNYVKDDGTGIVPAMTNNDPGPQKLYTATWQYSGPTYSKANHEFWMFGGGHAGTTNNLVTKYVLHQDSPAVVVACHATLEAERKLWCGPANYAAYYPSHSYWPDGKPYCPHSYINNLYDDTRDEFFSFPVIAGIATSGDGGISMSGPGETRPDVIGLTRAGVWRADGFYPDVPLSIYDYAAEGSGLRAVSSDGSALFYWMANTNSPRYGLNKLVFATNSHVHVGGTVPLAQRCTEEHSGKFLLLRGTSPGSMQAWYCSSATGALTNPTLFGDVAVASGMALYGVTWAANLNCYFALWVSATMGTLPGEGAEGDITNVVLSKLVPSGSNLTVTTQPIAAGSGMPTRGGAMTGFAYDPLYQCLIMALCPLKVLKAIKVT